MFDRFVLLPLGSQCVRLLVYKGEVNKLINTTVQIRGAQSIKSQQLFIFTLEEVLLVSTTEHLKWRQDPWATYS